jgi:uncharacterized metal-binding protein YceD (DUF177 family)
MTAATHDDRTPLPPELDLDLVALARSGPGPYEVKAELPATWIAEVLTHTDAEVTRPAAVDLEVTALGEGTSYLIRGTILGSYSVPCARCLEPAAVQAGGELCIHYVRDRFGHGEHEDAEIESDSPDQRTFSGTHIDLEPLLEEQILVSYPIRALCSHGEACRGLCMHCGADLNAQPAGASACTVCGAEGAQVPIAADLPHEEDEAPPEVVETPWQRALQKLAGDKPELVVGGKTGKKKPDPS